MEVEGSLFKKLLGIRALFKSAVELDQEMIHYIAYDYDSRLFEITVAAQAKTAPIPAWTFKLVVPYSHLERILLIFEKIIKHYEKIFYKEDINGTKSNKSN